MRIGFIAAAAMAVFLVQPAAAGDSAPAPVIVGEELVLPEPEAMVQTLPHSPLPADEAALALPEPEMDAVAPYAAHGCRSRGETVYLTN
jgi:hypothetical protein